MKLPALESHTVVSEDTPAAETERRFTEKKITIFGKDTYYIQSGRRSKKKPTLVFLHGFLSDSKSLVPAVADLQYRGRILVPDLPGFGYSESFKQDPSAVNLGDYCDWLKAFLERTIQPDETVVLAGYSFGAYVVIQYLAGSRHVHVAHSILLTPVISLQPQVDFYTNNFLLLSRVSERIATNAWRMQHDFTTLYLSKSYRVSTKLKLLRSRKAELEYFNPPLVKSLFEQIKRMNLIPCIRALDVSIDVILAGKDNIAQNRMTVSAFEEAGVNDISWQTLAAAGHLAPMENHEEITRLLDKSINKACQSGM